MRSCGWLGEGSSIPELDDPEAEPDPALPSTEDVIRKTEQITKNIQELLRAAQENKHDRSVSAAQEPPTLFLSSLLSGTCSAVCILTSVVVSSLSPHHLLSLRRHGVPGVAVPLATPRPAPPRQQAVRA